MPKKKEFTHNRINLCFTWATKGKDPNTDEWNYGYLVPDAKCQKGTKTNHVVVCCQSFRNGIYEYPAENTQKYARWNNNGRICLYVPISDCEYHSFDEVDWTDYHNWNLKMGIIETQEDWFKNGKKEPHKKRQKPKWFLSNLIDSEGHWVGGEADA